MTRTSRRTTLVLALTAATAVLTVNPATAANGTVGQRETVCAQDLFVRVTAPHGAWMGTLYRGQTFLVEEAAWGLGLRLRLRRHQPPGLGPERLVLLTPPPLVPGMPNGLQSHQNDHVSWPRRYFSA